MKLWRRLEPRGIPSLSACMVPRHLYNALGTACLVFL